MGNDKPYRVYLDIYKMGMVSHTKVDQSVNQGGIGYAQLGIRICIRDLLDRYLSPDHEHILLKIGSIVKHQPSPGYTYHGIGFIEFSSKKAFHLLKLQYPQLTALLVQIENVDEKCRVAE